MSENQPEIGEKELEQVSGGNDSRASQDQLKLQAEAGKNNQPMETATSLMKHLHEINRSVTSHI